MSAVDRDATPWWQALAQGRLTVQRCNDCGRLRWPPRTLCGRCGSLTWEWRSATGRGTVASWIVNHHPFDPAFPPPYVVVMVRLDDQDDILMPGGWAGPADGGVLSIGRPVVAEFVAGPDGATLLQWR